MTIETIGEKLSYKIKNIFGQSLHIRHVDSGSSNGCESEMTALLNPIYDVQRFGIDFVASPRHADMLLVTGGVTRNLQRSLMATRSEDTRLNSSHVATSYAVFCLKKKKREDTRRCAE